MEKSKNTGYIDYTILRKRIRNIRIRVTGASEVIVSAPSHIPEGRITKFVEDNSSEIVRSLKKINDKRRASYPPNYTDGETFLYLGEKIRFGIAGPGKNIRVYNGELKLPVAEDSDINKRKAAFTRWAKRRAKEVFDERVKEIVPLFPGAAGKEIRISVRNMLSRWGSINTARLSISLSVHLLRCDPELIDYIITHELCHLKYRNHSKAFYDELEKFFPDRKRLDKRLNAYGLVDFW